MEKSKIDHMVGGKFKLGRKIGSGSFGELFLGIKFLAVFLLRFICLKVCVFSGDLIWVFVIRCKCANWRGSCC